MKQQKKLTNNIVRCYYGYSDNENQMPSKWMEFGNLAGVSEVTRSLGDRLILESPITLSFFVKSKERENNSQAVEREATRLCDIMNKDGFWIKIFNGFNERCAKVAVRGCHADIPMMPGVCPILHISLVFRKPR